MILQGVYGYAIGGSGRLRGGSRGVGGITQRVRVGKGGGFADLTDNVEALVAVASDSSSVTKKFPLTASNSDRIKPQITRNSGSSGITTSFATIFAGG